jgi:hypothetical protein
MPIDRFPLEIRLLLVSLALAIVACTSGARTAVVQVPEVRERADLVERIQSLLMEHGSCGPAPQSPVPSSVTAHRDAQSIAFAVCPGGLTVTNVVRDDGNMLRSAALLNLVAEPDEYVLIYVHEQQGSKNTLIYPAARLQDRWVVGGPWLIDY